MAQQTYRQLVNKAILESGVTLNDIGTGSSFTTPNDKMHTRFKTWVADAWKELQMEWPGMEFTQKQATILINPRVYVEAAAGGNTPDAADVLYGEDTGTYLGVGTKIDGTTADIHLLSGTWAANTAKAYIGLDRAIALYEDGDFFKINEWVDLFQSDGTTLTQNKAMRIKGPGRYDLQTEVSDLLDPDLNSFYIQEPGGSGTTANNTSENTQSNLTYVPYTYWPSRVNLMSRSFGAPSCFTQAPNGHIEFDVIPDTQYVLHFIYEGEPQVLSTETEVLSPAMKEQYEDAIVWKAVMHYADYDRKPEIYMRARKRYEYYIARMMHKEMPDVTFNRSLFR